MGLDMYLKRKKWIGTQYQYKGREFEGIVSIKLNGKEIPIDFNNIDTIVESAAYWRKANAIHRWFVENVQRGNDDCGEYNVSLEDLENLLKLCKKVKKKAIIKDGKIECGYSFDKDGNKIPHYVDGKYIENAEEIAKILPTQEGFFFGCTDYDQWYMQDIDYTIETLSKIIKEEKKLNKEHFYSDFTYHASW